MAPLVALPSSATPWPDPDWDRDPTAAADAIDGSRLDRLLDEAFDDQPTEQLALSLAVVVVHRGVLVRERYGPDVDAATTLISWSMAKSVLHALVGTLVADGLLDLEAPAPVPEWSDPGDPRREITFEHLLRMCPGLRFVEDYVDEGVSDVIEMLFGTGAADMGHFAASFPLDHPPGSVFNYSSGTSNIVARIVRDVLGGPDAVRTRLRERLFEPLGMTSATIKEDGAGTFVGSSYVFATAGDFARFGLLYLRGGRAGATEVLPPAWVDHARTRTPLPAEDRDYDYGAHWWLTDVDRGAFHAGGYEGQRICVDPRRDLVVVRLGKTPADLGPNLNRFVDDVRACFPEH